MPPEKKLDENYAHGDQDSYNEDLGFESIVDHPHLKENSLTRQKSNHLTPQVIGMRCLHPLTILIKLVFK